MKDPYEILGVARTASQDEIRTAYRALAKKHHPDLNPGDKQAEERFKEASAAYDLLSDPETRGRFDRGEIDATGAERRERSFYRAYADSEGGATHWRFGDDQPGGFGAEDLFSELFRNYRGAGGERGGLRMQGADVTFTLRCPFLDAANGAKRRVTLGDGKTLDITIPKGARDRQTLRLKGQGMPGIGGGPPGDAFIEIHVEPHAFFERKDDNIHIELPVTLDEAVLGAKVETPTIDGTVSLTVPPGSNTGTTLRLRGRGVASPDGKRRGDQYVRLRVVLPDEPDEALREFVAGWAKDHKYDVRGKAGMR